MKVCYMGHFSFDFNITLLKFNSKIYGENEKSVQNLKKKKTLTIFFENIFETNELLFHE